jgi:glycine amidinotransferase
MIHFKKDLPIVNSHNEWDKLEEVIIGAGFPESIPVNDITFKLFFHDNIYGHKDVSYSEPWTIDKKFIDCHKEDVEGFASLLKSHNITVVRPKIPESLTSVKTPAWRSTNYPALNVRDLTIIIGNEIIEIPSSCRYRVFENDYIKHIFLDYFKKGAKWTSAPRPIITDNSYDKSRIYKLSDSSMNYYEDLKSKFKSPLDCGIEIMFEAANCMRLGDKILFNAPTEHERLGVRWLQEQIGSKYKIWTCEIADNHIDSCFLPIRPGLAVITKDIINSLPKPLQKWDFIKAPFLIDPDYNSDYLPISSEKIFCNFLSISPSQIICFPEYYNHLAPQLKKYNVEVIPHRLRYARLFGGGHHCLSLDIRRKSKLENYF